MAAIGGILLASRLLAVNQSSGASDLLLLAIAGPVIAGTSLFGGRGSVWSALLGALVIGSISNGMDLLALESSVKFMVTGGVLLAAVIVDALARRQRQARAASEQRPAPGRGDRLRAGRLGLPCSADRGHGRDRGGRDRDRRSRTRARRRPPTSPAPRCCPTPSCSGRTPGRYDLVVVAAPNRAHVPLGLAALDGGLPVVIDKPLAASAADGRRLEAAARERGLMLAVFHNRRWDGDFLTVRRLLGEGALGEVLRFESRFERWRPERAADAWREAGDPARPGVCCSTWAAT